MSGGAQSAHRAVRSSLVAGLLILLCQSSCVFVSCDDEAEVRAPVAAEAEATCVCMMMYKPVCGPGNTTYGNACTAACAGVASDQLTQGECGASTEQNDTQQSCGRACPRLYAPVCSPEGVTYTNYCEAQCAGVTETQQGRCEERLEPELEPEQRAARGGVCHKLLPCEEGLECSIAPPLSTDDDAAGEPTEDEDAQGVCLKVAGENEECSGSLAPAYATLCGEGLYCKQRAIAPGLNAVMGGALGTLGAQDGGSNQNSSSQSSLLLGSSGTCTRIRLSARGDFCDPDEGHGCEEGLTCTDLTSIAVGRPALQTRPPSEALPRSCVKLVDEGSRCNTSLPPAFASHCAPGTVCTRSGELQGSSLLGAYGSCVRTDGAGSVPLDVNEVVQTMVSPPVAEDDGDAQINDAQSPTLLAQGEECSPSATADGAEGPMCQAGLTCTSLLELSGDVDEDAGAMPKSRWCLRLVDENEECNGTLSPAYASFCKRGLTCSRQSMMLGASGFCSKTDGKDVDAVKSGAASHASADGEAEEASSSEMDVSLGQRGDKCDVTHAPCGEGLTCGSIPAPSQLGPDGADEVVSHEEEGASRCIKLAAVGEACNPSVAPQFATHCMRGLSCDRSSGGRRFGGAGVCAANTVIEEPATAPLLMASTRDALLGARDAEESVVLVEPPQREVELKLKTIEDAEASDKDRIGSWDARSILAVATVAIALTLFAAVMTLRQSPSFAKHGHFRRASDEDRSQSGYFYYTPVGNSESDKAEPPAVGGLALT